jgi:hypothetical protein
MTGRRPHMLCISNRNERGVAMLDCALCVVALHCLGCPGAAEC